MVNKAGQIIRFASRGVYESVEGYGCTKCVAFGAGQVTNLCQAICKLANCAGFHWKELDSSNKEQPKANPVTVNVAGVTYVTSGSGKMRTCNGCVANTGKADDLCVALWTASNCSKNKHIWKLAESQEQAEAVAPVTTDIQNGEMVQYQGTYALGQQPAINFKPLTAEELVIATKVYSLMRETASSQHYISTGAAEALRGGSVYTLFFQHIPTGASLHIECPEISVAQDLWDLLANHPGFKLQCLRP